MDSASGRVANKFKLIEVSKLGILYCSRVEKRLPLECWHGSFCKLSLLHTSPLPFAFTWDIDVRFEIGLASPLLFFCSLWRMLGKERSWFSRKITCPYCGAHPSTFMLDYCCKEWQKSFFFHNPRVSWMSELFSTVEALNYIYVLKCFCLAGMHQHWENQNQKWKKGHVVVYFLFLLGFTWVAWHHFLPSLSPRLYCTDYSTVTIYCYMYVSGLFFQHSLKKLDQLVSGVALFE